MSTYPQGNFLATLALKKPAVLTQQPSSIYDAIISQRKTGGYDCSRHLSTNLGAVVLSSGVLDVLGVDEIVSQNFINPYRPHWPFGDRHELSFPLEGSSVLSPL